MIKLSPVKVEGYNDVLGFAFSVECFDEACASVHLENKIFTVASWRETAQSIEQAIILLDLVENEAS